METGCRDRILSSIEAMIRSSCDVLATGLDVGAGDGWYVARLKEHGVMNSITAVEVQRRPNSKIEPVLYDGRTLPFPDASFDLIYAIDVVHHSRNPELTLRELTRCAGKYLLLKDHCYDTALGYAALCVMDELGNRRFGVPSRYRYQRGFSWFPIIEGSGFTRIALTHPVPVHVGFMGRLTNSLQFAALWRRVC